MGAVTLAVVPTDRRVRTDAIAGAVGAAAVAVIVARLAGIGVGLPLVVAGAIGWLAPMALVRRRADRRLRAIERDVAPAISLLAVTVRSGLGLDAALDMVATEVGGPLGAELSIVCEQVRLGTPRSEALAQLRQRVPAPGVSRLVQTLHASEELGGSVSTTLTVLADDCRARRFQQARSEAAKLPVKLLFPVVFMIFPPMLVLLVGPAMVDIARTFGK